MSRALRIALLWLVALALPVQGVAASTMMFCGPAHESSAAHDHASHHDHSAHDAASASDDGAAGEPDTMSCSVCASCCTAATLPSPIVAQGPPPGHAVYQAELGSAAATFLTSGLDRPPRLLLV
jgi:hypothetical protein